jgi:hypothetical protein
MSKLPRASSQATSYTEQCFILVAHTTDEEPRCGCNLQKGCATRSELKSERHGHNGKKKTSFSEDLTQRAEQHRFKMLQNKLIEDSLRAPPYDTADFKLRVQKNVSEQFKLGARRRDADFGNPTSSSVSKFYVQPMCHILFNLYAICLQLTWMRFHQELAMTIYSDSMIFLREVDQRFKPGPPMFAC